MKKFMVYVVMSAACVVSSIDDASAVFSNNKAAVADLDAAFQDSDADARVALAVVDGLIERLTTIGKASSADKTLVAGDIASLKKAKTALERIRDANSASRIQSSITSCGAPSFQGIASLLQRGDQNATRLRSILSRFPTATVTTTTGQTAVVSALGQLTANPASALGQTVSVFYQQLCNAFLQLLSIQVQQQVQYQQAATPVATQTATPVATQAAAPVAATPAVTTTTTTASSGRRR